MPFQFDALILIGDTVQCFRNVVTKGGGRHLGQMCTMYV